MSDPLPLSRFRSLSAVAVAALGLLSVCLPAGCARDVSTRYVADVSYAPTELEDVAVLATAPDEPYIVIGEFVSEYRSPRSFVPRAAKMGAHAVIISVPGEYGGWGDDWSDQDTTSLDKTYPDIAATAIRFR